MEGKQHIALGMLRNSWVSLKKEKGWGFWDFILNSEAKRAEHNYQMAQMDIMREPQYLSESGNRLNRVQVDYDGGADMTHYGWKDRKEYEDKVLHSADV